MGSSLHAVEGLGNAASRANFQEEEYSPSAWNWKLTYDDEELFKSNHPIQLFGRYGRYFLG
jgi:hypothetical protein